MIQADNHEPVDIVRLIEPVKDIEVTGLNDSGYADWYWTGALEPSNLERKTWMDIAGNPEDVEEQVNRHLKGHPECRNRLLIEGAIEPLPHGVLVYTRAHGKS